ncbi:MAG TPA: GDL motif peptide-associated radical SAM/SPASM maturase [Pyrinomonadaceae bacterium]|nr:GDL motif peptide-associated radical SAM/SPASM maturase [Pyrinomonadaceae bacterium]
MRSPTRYLSSSDRGNLTPVHVVWEITLACDLKCHHCGSRAGQRRPTELSTEECLDVVRQLARLGTREVTLIGGEAYLRADWTRIIREIRLQGMDCTGQTGGLHLTPKKIREAAHAGLQALGVSIDGLRELHDELRGVKGSFDAALSALECLKKYGITTSVNTQITSLVLPQLRELFKVIVDTGARNWQVQLTVAMGRAADRPDIILQPYQLLELMPLLAELYEAGLEHGLLLQPGNNIGYFGPYEGLWRGSGDDRIYWRGCNAGQNTMGIEADGTIKGCPSLATATFAGGNVRDLTIEDIWTTAPELNFNQAANEGDLWGFCGSCYYAEVCQGGCTWTSDSLLGRPGNNPYCHHRVLELARSGFRERVVQVESAPGSSFDHGRFELIRERLADVINQPETLERASDAPVYATQLVQIKGRPKLKSNGVTRAAGKRALILCRTCNRHVFRGTRICPHCSGNVRQAASDYRENLRAAQEACRTLKALTGI